MKTRLRNAIFGILIASAGLVIAPAYAAPENTDTPMQEQGRTVTMQGRQVNLIGPEIKVGQKAPDFIALATDLSDVRLSDFKGKIKLICSVPSLDTPVCDLEIHRFNQEASQAASDVVIIFVSMDLPFAQRRFCAAGGINNVKTLSDHRYADFGGKYGVLIKDMRLLARAVFIIDKEDVVRYVQYVQEIGMQPDYESASKALKSIVR